MSVSSKWIYFICPVKETKHYGFNDKCIWNRLINKISYFFIEIDNFYLNSIHDFIFLRKILSYILLNIFPTIFGNYNELKPIWQMTFCYLSNIVKVFSFSSKKRLIFISVIIFFLSLDRSILYFSFLLFFQKLMFTPLPYKIKIYDVIDIFLNWKGIFYLKNEKHIFFWVQPYQTSFVTLITVYSV